MGEWEKAGPIHSTTSNAKWYCEIPENEWDVPPATVKKDFHGTVGDKRQEIVLIGVNMNQDHIIQRLNACLLTDAEFQLGPDEWVELEDPLSSWEIESDEEGDDASDHN